MKHRPVRPISLEEFKEDYRKRDSWYVLYTEDGTQDQRYQIDFRDTDDEWHEIDDFRFFLDRCDDEDEALTMTRDYYLYIAYDDLGMWDELYYRYLTWVEEMNDLVYEEHCNDVDIEGDHPDYEEWFRENFCDK